MNDGTSKKIELEVRNLYFSGRNAWDCRGVRLRKDDLWKNLHRNSPKEWRRGVF